MKYFFAIITQLLFVFALQGQYVLQGRIVDRETGQPLPFVNIIYNQQGQGVTSNLEGNFEITTSHRITQLRTSYVGYLPESIAVDDRAYAKPMLLGLTPTAYDLEEVVVRPGENPAHRIINLVYENRQRNNPERLAQFRYNSYSKMYFTAQRDTINLKPKGEDGEGAPPSTDSLELKVEKVLKQQHLMMMESITERIFMHPNRSHETILASKVSGFKDPLLAFLTTQYQSFSFYPELLNLGGKFHLNPISKNSTRRYLFILEDTLFTPSADTVFVVSFRPLRNANFAGLQGVMNINSNGYAIQNVIAEPVEAPSPVFNIKIQQRYQLIDSVQWFPVELNTTLYLNSGSVQLQDSTSKQVVKFMMVGRGSTYIDNIDLLPNLRPRDFSHVAVSFDPTASLRDDAFWDSYRVEPLTAQELRTYHFVDSISKQANLDRMMNILDALIMGKIPIGIFNLDLNQIMDYNRFEGYRLGLGLETNQRVSKWFTLGGYYAYGFSDKEDKFGGFARLTLSQLHQVCVEGRYSNDVREPGEVVFERQTGMINTDLFRTFMIDRMDYTQSYSAGFGFRFLKRFTLGLSAVQTDYNIASGYGFEHPLLASPFAYRTNELGLQLKFAWRESYIQTLKGLMPFGFEHPIVWLNVAKGIELNDKGFDYLRCEARISHKINHRIIGKTNISLTGGVITGDVPTSLLYFTPGSMDKYPLDATNSFGTIHPFEFVSDRYFYAFLRHNFGELFGKSRSALFKPQLEVVQNFAIGSYSENPFHAFVGVEPKSLSLGFFESGLLLNGLLANPFYSLGVGAYYRWGTYTNPAWSDNVAIKLTIATNF